MTELLNSALSVGYRSIDTARNYRNEIEIGESLSIIFSEGKFKREDIYITSKLFPFNIKKHA